MYLTKALAATALAVQGAYAGDRSDKDRTFQEICIENGFDFESHTVTTEDGYILTVYRIPGLQGESPDPSKPPVMF